MLIESVIFLEFKDISYIISICEHKNISQAARSLFISQPALSQQLHKIEQKLGKTLFIRSGHFMEPTAACRIIAEQGSKLLAERDMMMYALSHLQEKPDEMLRFGMSPFYARHMLPGLMHAFQEKHPHYNLKFVDKGNSRHLEQDVLDNNLDCCLLPMHPSNPDIEYLPIGMEEILLAVPRDHPINRLETADGAIDIAITRNEPFILHRNSDKIAALQDILFANAGFTPRGVHVATGWDTVTSFISSGLGLGLLTELILGDYRPENLPFLYRIRNMDMSRVFALGYRRGRIPTPAMKCLLEEARAEFARLKVHP